jgi:hypothetical protein
MALRLSSDLKGLIVDRVITAVAGTYGTAGTASISFYTGAQPATADTAPSGSKLCEILNISWVQSTGGTSALTAQFHGTASSSGTCGWARITTVSGIYTYSVDGDVGTASTNTIAVNSAIMTSAGLVTLVTAPFIMT